LDMRYVILFSVVLILAVSMPSDSYAARDIPSGARVFYNPFPLQYDRYLVKVLDGLEPGHSTLQDAVRLYGEPYAVANETYFYWEWRTSENVKQVRMSFFPPKKRMKPRHNVCGFDGRAMIKEIRCFDARRMGYATYLSDLINFTTYPYELRFYAKDNRYEMQFYEQGYSMYFDGETEQFMLEEYFPHEDLILRGVYYLSIGTGGLLYIEEDYLN